jgi:acyl-CoA thioester hydrolase
VSEAEKREQPVRHRPAADGRNGCGDWIYSLEMMVRDYECDLQGIVNNAVYQNYFEHARHQYIRKVGLDFAEMHLVGIDPVVCRIEIDYKQPLHSGDRFETGLRVALDGKLKLVFLQDIVKRPSDALAAQAKVITVMTRSGKPIPPSEDMVRRLIGGRTAS